MSTTFGPLHFNDSAFQVDSYRQIDPSYVSDEEVSRALATRPQSSSAVSSESAKETSINATSIIASAVFKGNEQALHKVLLEDEAPISYGKGPSETAASVISASRKRFYYREEDGENLLALENGHSVKENEKNQKFFKKYTNDIFLAEHSTSFIDTVRKIPYQYLAAVERTDTTYVTSFNFLRDFALKLQEVNEVEDVIASMRARFFAVVNSLGFSQDKSREKELTVFLHDIHYCTEVRQHGGLCAFLSNIENEELSTIENEEKDQRAFRLIAHCFSAQLSQGELEAIITAMTKYDATSLIGLCVQKCLKEVERSEDKSAARKLAVFRHWVREFERGRGDEQFKKPQDRQPTQQAATVANGQPAVPVAIPSSSQQPLQKTAAKKKKKA